MSRLQESDTRSTVTVRIDENLKQAYQDEVESMSADLREHIKETVDEPERDVPDLGDERLTNGYAALLDAVEIHSSPDSRSIDAEIARSHVANRLDMPVGAVRARIFEPLRTRNLVRPAWGSIIVREVRDE
jgi:hypothetical protein